MTAAIFECDRKACRCAEHHHQIIQQGSGQWLLSAFLGHRSHVPGVSNEHAGLALKYA
jgi:hypothetical protein